MTLYPAPYFSMAEDCYLDGLSDLSPAIVAAVAASLSMRPFNPEASMRSLAQIEEQEEAVREERRERRAALAEVKPRLPADYPRIKPCELQVGDIAYIRATSPRMPHFSGTYHIVKVKTIMKGRVQLKLRSTWTKNATIQKIDLEPWAVVELKQRDGISTDRNAA